jgi:hypothetical protein
MRGATRAAPSYAHHGLAKLCDGGTVLPTRRRPFCPKFVRDGPPRINTFPALAEAAMAAVAFRDDLARFPVIGSTRREHIERWMEDPRVQVVWEKLAATAPDLEPKAFIHFVLMLRQGVSDASAQRYYIEKCNTWRAKYNKVLKRLVSSQMPDLELARQLENVVEGLQLNAAILSFVTTLGRDNSSRQEEDGARARKLFEMELSRYFQDICGQWLDREVAALTEIAFPGKEINEDMVRGMRRSCAKVQVSLRVPSNDVSIVPDQ